MADKEVTEACKWGGASTRHRDSRHAMKRWLKFSLGFVAGAVVAAQFVRPEHNLSSAPPSKDDFVVAFSPPPAVREVLKNACYDCHSDHTRYPWYSNVQPLGWWLARHVDEGKGELNLSEFGSYSKKVQLRKLNQMSETVNNREMPLPSYTWGHPEARLTDQQVATFTEWIDGLYDELDTE